MCLEIHQSAQLQFVRFCRIELASRCSICNHQIEINRLLWCEQTCFKGWARCWSQTRNFNWIKKKFFHVRVSLLLEQQTVIRNLAAACWLKKRVPRANLSSTRLNSSNCQSQWIEAKQALFDLDQRRLVLSCCVFIDILFEFARIGGLYASYITQ